MTSLLKQLYVPDLEPLGVQRRGGIQIEFRN